MIELSREGWPFRVLLVEGDAPLQIASCQLARLVERAGAQDADAYLPDIASVDMRRCRNRDHIAQPDGPTERS